MVPTFGLTHIALAVRDVDRSSRFYRQVFGAVEVYRQAGFAQLQTPGARDVLVLEEDPERAGPGGGIAHFGFRLTAPADIDIAREAVVAAGGVVRDHGEFVPGEPYLFALDPDGYEFEIWYELPTPMDPPGVASSEVARVLRTRATNSQVSAGRASARTVRRRSGR